MNHLIDEEGEDDEESEIVNGDMVIHLNNISIDMPHPHDEHKHKYCIAEGVLKDIVDRLSLLTKVDSSLIDKKYHKKFLKKELHKYLLRLNAAQLKTFMENYRTLLTKAEQMFKLL